MDDLLLRARLLELEKSAPGTGLATRMGDAFRGGRQRVRGADAFGLNRIPGMGVAGGVMGAIGEAVKPGAAGISDSGERQRLGMSQRQQQGFHGSAKRVQDQQRRDVQDQRLAAQEEKLGITQSPQSSQRNLAARQAAAQKRGPPTTRTAGPPTERRRQQLQKPTQQPMETTADRRTGEVTSDGDEQQATDNVQQQTQQQTPQQTPQQGWSKDEQAQLRADQFGQARQLANTKTGRFANSALANVMGFGLPKLLGERAARSKRQQGQGMLDTLSRQPTLNRSMDEMNELFLVRKGIQERNTTEALRRVQ
jgi:hypothetical protein